jgi:hypothetical protein
MFLLLSSIAIKAQTFRSVFQDKDGVIRWTDNKQEVALFGANYCLPSACDYRAAKYVGGDLKKMVDEDMAHFSRMGWDALRLCLWGDYENSDSLGNLVNNDHLNLMDYVIFKARQRGIYFLFSPIVTYSSQFPDAYRDTTSARGFSTYFKKSELGTNPKAIAAQENYLKQILNHVNPYTGIAIKNEPGILFIEMINEPTHHSKDVEGSVRYINALVDAVRSTGCSKILFHNYSQDFTMAKSLQDSKIQGVSFAWYPTGLNSGRTLQGNYLPDVDHYSDQMLRPEISKLSRIVYEFDSPDLLNGYMYPAMARAFREVGAQLATMFSYDMLATAPYNLGWQTHCLNMVYTPKKAVSAIIAAEVMKTIPRLKNFGNYPTNTSFGPFRISYSEDLGEMNAQDKFLYANNTHTFPQNIQRLKKIVGYGSSPVVNYDGQGIYFLDKIKPGVWRLEVYPDAVQVKDPFNIPSPAKLVLRSLHKAWPMSVSLPDLGNTFSVVPLNSNNNYNTAANDKRFIIQPGVYILTADQKFKKEGLPGTVGFVGMTEFYSPADQELPTQAVPNYQPAYYAGKPITISANVYGRNDSQSVTLFLKGGGRGFFPIPMTKEAGYLYKADIPASRSNEGWIEYCIVVKDNNSLINFPSGINKSPSDWDYNDAGTWKAAVVKEKTPLRILDPAEDAGKLGFTRIGDGIRFGIYKLIPSTETGEASFHLELPLSYDKNLRDYTLSVTLKEKIAARKGDIAKATILVLNARGVNQQQQAYITLVENDGTGWSKKIELKPEWSDVRIPLDQLELSKAVLLPMGYPGEWKYWIGPATGRGGQGDKIKMENVEWIQLSVRQSDLKKEDVKNASWIDISSAVIQF